MRVLLTDATGFIGSAVLARLVAEGHEVRAVARRPGAGLTPAEWRNLDIAHTTDAAAWRPHLEDVDAVVHCAGVLQDGPGDSSRGGACPGYRGALPGLRERRRAPEAIVKRKD